MKKLKEILYAYANTHGGGLPLTAEEVCNAVILWVQEYGEEQLKKAGDITVERLLELVKGSDTVVVDESEDGGEIEIHADYENVVQPIERAIKIPIASVIYDLIPIVKPSKEVEFIPANSYGAVYRHDLLFNELNSGNQWYIYFDSTKKDKYTNGDYLIGGFKNGECWNVVVGIIGAQSYNVLFPDTATFYGGVVSLYSLANVAGIPFNQSLVFYNTNFEFSFVSESSLDMYTVHKV